MSATVVAHTLIALAICLAVTLITGWPVLGGFIGAIVYPIRELRQYYKGKGAGFAAAIVPAAAAILAAICLIILRSAGIEFL